ncbi:undecaprenyldiphospho-muramoylpentapeptide beta-N-acetylglucosaminyltransferase [bacterium]|nr:undecaprenyldiphospho-muramoylpentapeptide beta-N-acetylglucosaminyltransferase [bacterium]
MSLNTHRRIRVILAGGGTGGHIYPGVALANEFMARKDKKIDCLMLITSRHGDEYILKNERIPYRILPVEGMRLGLSINTFMDLYRFAISFVRSWRIISVYMPDIIIGLGAYASFPAVIIGRTRGITTLIQEQNSLPGKANRFLGRWVDGIFTSFPESKRFFPSHKTRALGNPIRFVPEQTDKRQHRSAWGLMPDLFTVMVCGGSRGAHTLNLNAVEAFRIMKKKDIPFQAIHQTGKDDFEWTKRFYDEEGIKALTSPFFDRMMEIYPLADIVISRSGAGTVSELAASGIPAVLIPYPYAKADHQRVNAMSMARTGAARLIDEAKLKGRSLADEIIYLFQNPERLNEMGRASLRMGRPDAARKICDQALLWLEEKERDKRGRCILN